MPTSPCTWPRRRAAESRFYDPAEDRSTLRRLTPGHRAAPRHRAQRPRGVVPARRPAGHGRGASSCEALLRWSHDQFGPISPVEFIPVAESAGLIDPLTWWVLDTALAQLKSWREIFPGLSVAVNLSARSLMSLDISLRVDAGAAPRQHAAVGADAGADRVVGHGRPAELGTGAARPAGAGREPVHRRLRHRVLVAQPPEAPAVPGAEDRPVVRQGDDPRPGRRGHRPLDHRAGPQPGPHRDRRGRRGPGHPATPAEPRLPRRPGLLPGPAPARPAVRGVAAGRRGRPRPAPCGYPA